MSSSGNSSASNLTLLLFALMFLEHCHSAGSVKILSSAGGRDGAAFGADGYLACLHGVRCDRGMSNRLSSGAVTDACCPTTRPLLTPLLYSQVAATFECLQDYPRTWTVDCGGLGICHTYIPCTPSHHLVARFLTHHSHPGHTCLTGSYDVECDGRRNELVNFTCPTDRTEPFCRDPRLDETQNTALQAACIRHFTTDGLSTVCSCDLCEMTRLGAGGAMSRRLTPAPATPFSEGGYRPNSSSESWEINWPPRPLLARGRRLAGDVQVSSRSKTYYLAFPPLTLPLHTLAHCPFSYLPLDKNTTAYTHTLTAVVVRGCGYI